MEVWFNERDDLQNLSLLPLASTLTIGNSQHSQGQSIFDSGFDLFNSPEGHSFVDLGGPIGLVDLVGEPFGPANTDTIVERLTDPFPILSTSAIRERSTSSWWRCN